uniref:Arylsulfatase F n=1 Tax=Ornithorhynchus anatinus TaxID=9258 RepID=A0A6I8N972_ORNAN
VRKEVKRGFFMGFIRCLLRTRHCTKQAGSKPNIMLIVVDDLGIGDLGCYGNDTMRTPNIDRLAKQGVRLTQHISAASMCTPSRAAILTGRYPVRSGMASNNDNRVFLSLDVSGGLPRNETTFAALLEKQGYSTGIIGKWHQGLNCKTHNDHCHHPIHYGFQSYYGMPYTLIPPCWPDPSRDTELAFERRLWLCMQLLLIALVTLIFMKLKGWLDTPWLLILFIATFGFLLALSWYSSYTSSLYWDCILMRNQEITEQPMKGERAGSIMLKEAVSFLQRNREGPFLLFFSFLHVHVPLPTTKEFLGVSQHGLYGDNVEEMDSLLGKLVDAVDANGLGNNTLILFTSDHGGHLEARNGHIQMGGWNGIYKGGKGMGGWEGGIRVPAIARWPGVLPAGTVINQLTSSMDFYPTMAALGGGILPKDRVIDGRDLMPLLRGDVQRSDHEFLFHYCGSYLHAARWQPKNSAAVWKVHYVTPIFEPKGAGACYEIIFCACYGENVTHHDPPLLFDLSKDPSESQPLSRESEPLYDSVIQTVGEALKRHRRSLTPVPQVLSEQNEHSAWRKPCCGVFPFCLCDKEDGHSGAQGDGDKSA